MRLLTWNVASLRSSLKKVNVPLFSHSAACVSLTALQTHMMPLKKAWECPEIFTMPSGVAASLAGSQNARVPSQHYQAFWLCCKSSATSPSAVRVCLLSPLPCN